MQMVNAASVTVRELSMRCTLLEGRLLAHNALQCTAMVHNDPQAFYNVSAMHHNGPQWSAIFPVVCKPSATFLQCTPWSAVTCKPFATFPQYIAIIRNDLQAFDNVSKMHCNAPQCTAMVSNDPQFIVMHCNGLQAFYNFSAIHCNALQYTAVVCNGP